MIERFADFPKNFFIDFHNFFQTQLDKEYNLKQLDVLTKIHQEETQYLDFIRLLREFLKKYDVCATFHLIRVFEGRK